MASVRTFFRRHSITNKYHGVFLAIGFVLFAAMSLSDANDVSIVCFSKKLNPSINLEHVKIVDWKPLTVPAKWATRRYSLGGCPRITRNNKKNFFIDKHYKKIVPKLEILEEKITEDEYNIIINTENLEKKLNFLHIYQTRDYPNFPNYKISLDEENISKCKNRQSNTCRDLKCSILSNTTVSNCFNENGSFEEYFYTSWHIDNNQMVFIKQSKNFVMQCTDTENILNGRMLLMRTESSEKKIVSLNHCKFHSTKETNEFTMGTFHLNSQQGIYFQTCFCDVCEMKISLECNNAQTFQGILTNNISETCHEAFLMNPGLNNVTCDLKVTTSTTQAENSENLFWEIAECGDMPIIESSMNNSRTKRQIFSAKKSETMEVQRCLGKKVEQILGKSYIEGCSIEENKQNCYCFRPKIKARKLVIESERRSSGVVVLRWCDNDPDDNTYAFKFYITVEEKNKRQPHKINKIKITIEKEQCYIEPIFDLQPGSIYEARISSDVHLDNPFYFQA